MPMSSRESGHTRESGPGGTAIFLAILGVGVLWAFWHTAIDLWKDWQRDANYSVGQLVPVLAALLVWRDRAGLRRCARVPCWWGAAMLAGGLAGQAAGSVLLFNSLERYSIVVAIAGTVLLVWGWEVFQRCRWVLAFLLLMVPLPGRIHNAISGPLQRVATAGTVVVLESLGNDVDREGNILLINSGEPLGVAESCSGLRMMTAFLVISAALAFLIEGPGWWRIAIVVSGIPVAIVCNVIRLAATATLATVLDARTLEVFVHDFAGIAMMPIAVLLLVGLVILLRKLDPRAPTANRT